jgi:uncharacterized OsmC-like protein
VSIRFHDTQVDSMSSEVTHHVTLRLARDFEFVAEFNDIPSAGAVMFDEPPPLGGGKAPNAAAMLGAAVGNCLAASLTFCLRQARIEVLDVTAHVRTHVVRNDKGRFRITGIDVDLVPALGRTDRAVGVCDEPFEDFCTVTASIRHGIPVRVSLKDASAVGATAKDGSGTRES